MTSASRRLHLTQGAISQQIARLELLAGGALLLREARGLRLTALGERLLGRARAFVALNDEVWSELERSDLRGRVRLGVPYDLVGTTLAPALQGFSEAAPQVKLSLVGLPSPDLIDAVRTGRLDLAVAEEPAGFETGEVLAVERLLWVGAKGGRAHRRDPLPLSLVAETCVFRSVVAAALAKHGRETRAVFENGGLDATRATVRMDLAVSAWLTSTVPPELDILYEAGLPELPSFAITVHGAAQAQSAAVRELLSHLRNAAARPRAGS
ncbi:LysR substrate-binding domain-containing protein [Hyphomicrobiales bacterium BP6-180914]|uniref:LysR substrate-binding domain-containing protein n=2 Tax=Lichenifustis flavocetrariae TaxID=2949735 RepID=A0AA41YU73_9HYPH|nr:LysR substrate-binding domain-containing protein [Lichenifustis flavocetrariae]